MPILSGTMRSRVRKQKKIAAPTASDLFLLEIVDSIQCEIDLLSPRQELKHLELQYEDHLYSIKTTTKEIDDFEMYKRECLMKDPIFLSTGWL